MGTARGFAFSALLVMCVSTTARAEHVLDDPPGTLRGPGDDVQSRAPGVHRIARRHDLVARAELDQRRHGRGHDVDALALQGLELGQRWWVGAEIDRIAAVQEHGLLAELSGF